MKILSIFLFLILTTTIKPSFAELQPRWLCEGYCMCNELKDSHWGFAIRNTRVEGFSALHAHCENYCAFPLILDARQFEVDPMSACTKFEAWVEITPNPN